MDSQTQSSNETDMGPGEVGDLLRASRQRQGQELADVARTLRIRTVYLQAIEDSRYEDLPGTVYAIGFIRSYGDHLGLDGEQLIERFKAEGSGTRTARKPLMNFPAVVPENGIPRGAIITLGALILIGAYGSWYFLSTRDLYVADLIPPVPEAITRALEAGRAQVAVVTERTQNDPAAALARQSELRPGDSTAKSDLAVEPAADAKPGTQAAVEPPPVPVAPALSAAAPTPAPAPAAQPAPSPSPAAANDPQSGEDDEDEAERTPPPSLASAPPAPPSQQPGSQQTADAKPAAPATSAPASSDASAVTLDDRGGVDAPASGSQLASLPVSSGDPGREIVLKANVDSWIQIRDTNENKLVLTRLLRKGEQYTVPARDGLTLVTGNAGGLEITVGGESTPSLGPIGVVRRNILLDPDRLRAGTAIAE